MLSFIEKELEDIRKTPNPNIKRKIDLLNDLAWLLRWKDKDRARSLSREALNLSESTKVGKNWYEKGRGRSLRTIAYIDQRWARALSLLRKALSAMRKAGDILPQPVILARMGFLYGYHLGDWETAYTYISEAITIAEDLGDDFSLAMCLSSLGTIYILFADSEEAFEVLKRARNHAESVDAPFEEAIILNNYANVCMDLARPDEALEVLLTAFAVLENSGFSTEDPILLSTLGRIYTETGEREKAITTLRRALEAGDVSNFSIIHMECFILLSRIFINDDPELSREYADNALSIIDAYEDKYQKIDCYDLLAELEERGGEYEKAYHYLKLSSHLRSESLKKSAEARLKFFRMLHETENAKKEMEIHRRRAEELHTITEVGREILSTLDLSAVFLRMCTLVKDVLSASIVAFYKKDEDGAFRAVQVVGLYEEILLDQVLNENTGVTGSVIRTGAPELVNDTWIDPRTLHVPGTDRRDEDTRILMSVPLLDEEKVQGVLNIWRQSEKGAFTKEDLDFIVSLSHQASIAIRNAEMHTDLEKAWAHAKTANKAKSDFLAGVSHEIRTPMNAILAISSVLMEEGEGIITRRTLEGIYTIQRSSRRLLQLVNGLLDISKIEAGRMNLEEQTLHIDTLLNHVRTVFSAFSRNTIKFTIHKRDEVPEAVVLDGKKLEQIIINLVGNAFKYTKEGTVRLVVDSEDYNLLIVVSDTGVGISPENISRVFEPFFHEGHSYMEQDPGSGVGLNLCKSYVDIMRGSINVKSTPGEGTMVRLSLPFTLPGPEVINQNKLLTPANQAILHKLITLYSSTAPEYIEELRNGIEEGDFSRVGQFAHKLTNITGTLKAEICHDISSRIESAVTVGKDWKEISSLFHLLEDAVKHSVEELSGIEQEYSSAGEHKLSPVDCRVLVVEDEEIGRVTYRMILEKDFDLAIAENGREAVDVYPQFKPDIVLLDISMPDMDGYETLAEMKRKYGTLVPIVAVTAHAGKGVEEHVGSSGFDGYISKPLEREHLKGTILGMCEQYGKYGGDQS